MRGENLHIGLILLVYTVHLFQSILRIYYLLEMYPQESKFKISSIYDGIMSS